MKFTNLAPLVGLALLVFTACKPASPTTQKNPESAPATAVGESVRPETDRPAAGGISIRTVPCPALVFVDGRFVGQSSSLGPIEILDDPGRHQIRISEAGHLDAVFDFEFSSGKIADVEVSLPAPDAVQSTPAEILLSVGQPLRDRLAGDEAVVYVVDEDFIPERMLVVIAGSPSFKVTDPDGKEVAVTEMAARPAGTPGNSFFEYRGPKPGRYHIEVRGKAGRCSWRFVQALPPLAETKDPKSKGRREPPSRPSNR